MAFIVVGSVLTQLAVVDELPCFEKLNDMGHKFFEIFPKFVVRKIEVRLQTISKIMEANCRQDMIDSNLLVVLQCPR